MFSSFALTTLSEALWRKLSSINGEGRAFSSGSHPAEKVNPLVIRTFKEFNLPTVSLRRNSWMVPKRKARIGVNYIKQ